MSETPQIAQKEPCQVAVKVGKPYFWCTCGRSAAQPFCDGSHKGSTFSPLPWKAQEDGEVWFCACKHSKNAPLCDGSHNTL